MRYKKPELICYDFDETLVTMDLVYKNALNIMCEKYGLRLRTDEDMEIINEATFVDVIGALFGAKIEPQMHQEYELGYLACSYNFSHLISGALEFVQKCHKLGIKQAIVSNKPDHIAIPEIKRFGFFDYVDAIVGTNCGYRKPDKKMFYEVLKQINLSTETFEKDVDSEKCDIWMFGDSTSDIEFAQNIKAKMFFIGKQERITKNIDLSCFENFTSFFDISF